MESRRFKNRYLNLPPSYISHSDSTKTYYDLINDLCTNSCLPSSVLEHNITPLSCHSVFHRPLLIVELLETFRKTNLHLVPGLDQISYRMLRILPNETQQHLLDVHNELLN